MATLAHMTDPIPLLRAVPNQPIPEIVAKIERLLADVKSGEVQAVAFAVRCADGSFDVWFGSSLSGCDFTLATGISRLAWRYQVEAFDEIVVVPDGPA